MPLSSAVFESGKANVISRDGGLCVLCGIDPVDVAHIVDGDYRRIDWIRRAAPSLSDFSRRRFKFNMFMSNASSSVRFGVLRTCPVPSKQQREAMLEHERLDFAMREEIVARGGGDPGRTFPELIDEYEYIPVEGGRTHLYVHNPTPYDPHAYIFGNADHQSCPLLHFRASHIALIVEANPLLSSIFCVQSPKGDVAQPQIATLLRLYGRQPGQHPNPNPAPPTTSVLENYEGFYTQLGQPNAAPAHYTSFANDGSVDASGGRTPSSSVSTTSASSRSQSEDAGDDMDLHAGGDMQLMEYAKERSVTWEELKKRPPLFGGEAPGASRFASANDICRFGG